ncbi:uncharacterized protein N7446_004937 [Penicillium canescens]|uniref:Enoyl reductase (ER) domain-containing protein n=1 Tax=Penicillium canescens TaxID=5083 RepID=A0AAD6I1G2_PENCN|nr:uncharacterized protein N7446_004937 [Penicillium canescens]KAJ6026464.1 hypothetical protein N7460_011281 [Penicillium canescens]KAJ6039747.1 hypothetical protein N7444_008652 [Penicillium canescens]KAJ6067900.1 hypothetical protein N7446_004937 [Penicillium canescens]
MSASNTGVWLLEAGGQFVVQEAPLYTPGPNEILVKNKAVAVNPMDWKIQLYGPHLPFPSKYPFILGADLAGEVYEVGKDVTAFKKGDRVAGNANWFLSHEIRDSAYQNYTIINTAVAVHLPDNISFTEGSVLPLAVSTSAMGLYPPARLGLPLPKSPKPEPIGKVILVWGGSSSCGSAAIQLAVASGATVVATASSKNHEFVRSLGAIAVLEYKSETVVQDLVDAVKIAGGKFLGALDAIGDDHTWKLCVDVVLGLGCGRVVSNNPRIADVPEGVEVLGVTDTANIGDNKEIVESVWGKFLPEALKDGTIKCVPEAVVLKGLDKVAEGVALCQKGVSAAKVVVEV